MDNVTFSVLCQKDVANQLILPSISPLQQILPQPLIDEAQRGLYLLYHSTTTFTQPDPTAKLLFNSEIGKKITSQLWK